MVSFFFLLLWIPGENKAVLKKLFNLTSRLRWGAQYPRYTECNYYFLSAIALMQVIFWIEHNFCFISDCNNLPKCNLKKLINNQIIIFCSPSNALRSFDEFVQIKHFKYRTFIGMPSLVAWFILQVLNFW